MNSSIALQPACGKQVQREGNGEQDRRPTAREFRGDEEKRQDVDEPQRAKRFDKAKQNFAQRCFDASQAELDHAIDDQPEQIKIGEV